MGADLTNVASLEKKLAECNVDYGRPTIFIAECVLVYVGAKEAANFLRWCVDKFAHSPLVFLNHEGRRSLVHKYLVAFSSNDVLSSCSSLRFSNKNIFLLAILIEKAP